MIINHEDGTYGLDLWLTEKVEENPDDTEYSEDPEDLRNWAGVLKAPPRIPHPAAGEIGKGIDKAMFAPPSAGATGRKELLLLAREMGAPRPLGCCRTRPDAAGSPFRG
jgi:hypothetical protein